MTQSDWKQCLKSLWWYLGEISVFQVCSGHAVQPGPSQFRGAGVGPGQAVLEVQQHLGVFFVLSHLSCGHQNCADPLCQSLHFSGERRGLRHAEMSKQTQTWSHLVEKHIQGPALQMQLNPSRLKWSCSSPPDNFIILGAVWGLCGEGVMLNNSGVLF